MSPQLITCPKCSTQLRVNRDPASAVKVVCPTCSQALKLGPISASQSQPADPSATRTGRPSPSNRGARPTQAAMPLDPLADFPGSPALPPKPLSTGPSPIGGGRGNGPRRRTPNAKRARVNRKPILVACGILAGIGVASGVGLLIYKHLPIGSIAKLNPLADSPESILSGMKSILTSAAVELDSIQDDASRGAAISELNDLASQARDLQRRAVMLRPISEERRRSIEQRFESEFEPVSQKLKAALAQVRSRDLGDADLTNAALLFSFAVSDVGSAISVGWKELPHPQDDWESLEYEKTVIERDVWRKVLGAVSQEDYENLSNELAEIPSRYDALAGLQKKVATSGTAKSAVQSPYRDSSFDFGFQVAERVARLTEEFGPNPPLSDLLERIRSAKSALTGIQVEAEIAQEADQFGGPLGPGFPDPKVGVRRPDRGGGAQPSKGPINTGSRPYATRFDLGAPPDSPDLNETRLQNFTGAQGRKNVVIIRFTGLPDDLRLGPQAAKLNQTLGKAPTIIARDGDQAALAYRYQNEIGDVAELIDVGRVTQTDSQRRIIFVDASSTSRK